MTPDHPDVTSLDVPTVALILDVDGVVSPVKGTTAWGDDVEAGWAFGPVPVSPTLVARLDALADTPGLVCLWLTSWSPGMRANMDPFPGSDWPDVPEVPETDEWWKWSALDSWLRDHPEITRLVWCDDDLHRTHLTGHELEDPHPDLRPAISAALAERGIAALLIAPTTTAGLTPGDLTRIGQHLHGQ